MWKPQHSEVNNPLHRSTESGDNMDFKEIKKKYQHRLQELKKRFRLMDYIAQDKVEQIKVYLSAFKI
jgi:hypothetical protein